MSELPPVPTVTLPSWMAKVIHNPCGCVNGIDRETGIQRAWLKCSFHKSESGKCGVKYHEELGVIVNGQVIGHKHVTELKEALIELNAVPKRRPRLSHALEIGCGVGVYIQWLVRLGYRYHGIEPDREAAEFAIQKFGRRNIGIQPKRFEDFMPRTRFSLILACHVFEHMEHSPEQIRRAAAMLENGGRIIILVPDDEDPVNPDHLWFYRREQLEAVMRNAGLRNVRSTMRRHVAHEQFIYAVGEK